MPAPVVPAVATTITGLYFRQRAKTKSAENWIAKLNKEPVPGKLTPKLHVSWRGLSGWCWAQHDGERVFRISGDGPILLEDTQEKAIITGVLIEGAEFVGVFDNFELSPGKPTFRGMNLDFKGINPVDKEPVTVKLTFVDLRGNKYPTNETTFKPLSLPNQSGGLPWPQ
jgi:hypothetical protein